MNQKYSFNGGWKFARADISAAVYPNYPMTELAAWETVTLPHTPRYEPYRNGSNPTFQGAVMYRKHFSVPAQLKDKLLFLEFEAVMGVADVWINGVLLHTKFGDAAPDQDGTVHTNCGGYLPFVVELTPYLNFDGENVLVVRADNSDNPQVPPGKPQALLDFTYFGGIYRNVWLDVLEPVHITNPLFEDIPNGGGVVFSYTLNRSTVKVHVRNTTTENQQVTLSICLGDIAHAEESFLLPALTDKSIETSLYPEHPQLWSLESPYLYTLECTLMRGHDILDRHIEKVGLRQITVSRKEGLRINGLRAPLLSGVNRHQDFPLIGNAATACLQRHDAILYKSAGFSVVRSAHYPMSVDFLCACDELGILVIEATPGWQWYPSGDDIPFTVRVHQNIRQMVRRDRNHPCVLAYETVLNETYHIPPGYTRRMEEIALEESEDARVAAESYGYDAVANGIDDLADFIYGFQDPLKKTKKALMFLREYGDSWLEAYGGRMSRRVTRGHCDSEYPCGKEENLAKANNLLFDHRDDIYTLADCQRLYHENPSFAGCAIWTGIDSRGMWSKLSPCGIWDSWRLPKIAYYAFASQRQVERKQDLEKLGVATGPVLYPVRIGEDVYVYSNGDYVNLEVFEGTDCIFCSQKRPLSDKDCKFLAHPPFYFCQVPQGMMKVQAYDRSGVLLAETVTEQTGAPQRLVITLEPSKLQCGDVALLYASVLDEHDQLCEDFEGPVTFSVSGCGEIVADGVVYAAANPSIAEAGIACAYLRAGEEPSNLIVYASTENLHAELHCTVCASSFCEFPFIALPSSDHPRKKDDDWNDLHPVTGPVVMKRRDLAHGCFCTASSNSKDANRVMEDGRFWETMWVGDRIDGAPEYFEVDLGKPRSIEDVMVHIGGQMGSDCTNYTYEIHTSEDRENWHLQAQNRRTSWSNGVLDCFCADKVRYLRVVFTHIDGGLLPAISKIEVYAPDDTHVSQ